MMGRAKSIAINSEQLSLLPPPPFCPDWPKKHTLEDRALALLMAGRVLDHPAFEGDCGSWRLAAVVFNLRALGWPIETMPTPSPTEKSPSRTVALYHLPSKYIAQALAGVRTHEYCPD